VGLSQINASKLKPIKKLSEFGLFETGGMLVRSHAFAASESPEKGFLLHANR
jgi:hypothetical protein